MSLLKSEAKLSAVNELGCRLDDVLEGSTQDLYRSEGAVSGLKQAVSSLEGLLKILDKELNDNEVDLNACKIIKSYVDRARITVVNLATNAELNRQSQVGKIQGFQQAVAIAKKYKDEELNKLQMIKTAIDNKLDNSESTSAEGRQSGAPPGPSIKSRRLAEEAAGGIDNSVNLDSNVPHEQSEELTKIKQKRQKK